MPTTIQEIYTQVIARLSLTERLQLATLILNGLAQQNATVVDDNDVWAEQDQLDLTAFSLQYAAIASPDEEKGIA